MAEITQFQRAIQSFTRVGVDSSIFIYLFEKHPQFAPLCAVLFDRLSDGKLSLVTSTVTAGEILVRPFQQKDVEVLHAYENVFATLPSFALIPVSYPIAKIAAQLRAEYRILLPDAIQLATAIRERTDAFVTNDRQLKRIKDIPVLCLWDYR